MHVNLLLQLSFVETFRHGSKGQAIQYLHINKNLVSIASDETVASDVAVQGLPKKCITFRKAMMGSQAAAALSLLQQAPQSKRPFLRCPRLSRTKMISLEARLKQGPVLLSTQANITGAAS